MAVEEQEIERPQYILQFFFCPYGRIMKILKNIYIWNIDTNNTIDDLDLITTSNEDNRKLLHPPYLNKTHNKTLESM